MGSPAWFEKPTALQAAEIQYVRSVFPLLAGSKQLIGGTVISAKVLPAIGGTVPERLQVTAPSKDGLLCVTSVGSEHIVEFAPSGGGLYELQGAEKTAALDGITAAVWRNRDAHNRHGAR